MLSEAGAKKCNAKRDAPVIVAENCASYQRNVNCLFNIKNNIQQTFKGKKCKSSFVFSVKIDYIGHSGHILP